MTGGSIPKLIRAAMVTVILLGLALPARAEVRALVEREIQRGNAGLAPVSQIKRFHLLTKELDHDDGEVTATMKVRRSSIYKTYANEIEALYS